MVKEEEKKPELITFTLAPPRKVVWAEGTVDNEHMNKRKSKSKYTRVILTMIFSLLHL